MVNFTAYPLLVGIIVFFGIRAEPVFFGHQEKRKAEFDKSLNVEGVLVFDDAPRYDPLSHSLGQLIGFCRVVHFWDHTRNDLVQVWADGRRVAWKNLRNGEWEIVTDWECSHVRKCGEPNIFSRRIALVYQLQLRLESDSGLRVLNYHAIEKHDQVGPALQFSNDFLPVSDLSVYCNAQSHGFGVLRHRYCYPFHGHGGSRSLSDRGLYVRRLATSNFIHFFDRLFQSAGLQSKDYQLSKIYQSYEPGQFDHPPIGRRLVLVFGGTLIGLFFIFRGSTGRGRINGIFVFIGVVLAFFSCCLWFITFCRFTWGWRL